MLKRSLFPYLVFGCDGGDKNTHNIKITVLTTFKRVVCVSCSLTSPWYFVSPFSGLKHLEILSRE